MSDRDDKEQRLGLWIAGGAAALATLGVLFFSIWGWETGKIEDSPNYAKNASALVVDAAASGEENAVEEAENAAVSDAQNEIASEINNNETIAPNDTGNATISEPDASAAAVMVENGIVKFYFATGKADVADGAKEALQDVLAGVKEGRKAIISGYHDETGNQAQNEALSKKRALAVKQALLDFGVSEDKIELRKPENSEGSGDNAEARRVEVVLE